MKVLENNENENYYQNNNIPKRNLSNFQRYEISESDKLLLEKYINLNEQNNIKNNNNDLKNKIYQQYNSSNYFEKDNIHIIKNKVLTQKEPEINRQLSINDENNDINTVTYNNRYRKRILKNVLEERINPEDINNYSSQNPLQISSYNYKYNKNNQYNDNKSTNITQEKENIFPNKSFLNQNNSRPNNNNNLYIQTSIKKSISTNSIIKDKSFIQKESGEHQKNDEKEENSPLIKKINPNNKFIPKVGLNKIKNNYNNLNPRSNGKLIKYKNYNSLKNIKEKINHKIINYNTFDKKDNEDKCYSLKQSYLIKPYKYSKKEEMKENYIMSNTIVNENRNNIGLMNSSYNDVNYDFDSISNVKTGFFAKKNKSYIHKTYEIKSHKKSVLFKFSSIMSNLLKLNNK